MKDYYKILNLNKDCSQEDIKKSYRKLSLLHHPDRPGGSEVKCKKINEAYDILGDVQKRKRYDLESSNPFLNMSSNSNPMDPINLFSKLFSGGVSPGNMRDNNIDPMFPFAPGMGPKIHIFKAGFPGGNMQFPDFENNTTFEEPDILELNIKLSLVESYNGCNKPIQISKYIIKNGKKSYENETIYVNFYPGIDNNECIIIKERGNIVNNEVGDIKVKVQLESINNYQRDGLDLIYNKYLTLNEALCGFSFLLEHLNGKSYKINHNGEYIIQPNHNKEIPNMGFIRQDDAGKLIIRFHISFPINLTLEQRKKISDIINESNEEQIKEEESVSID